MRTIHHGDRRIALPAAGEKATTTLVFWAELRRPRARIWRSRSPKKSGIPLKIAGEVQPTYKGYWETMVKPHVDGKFIEYVGEVGMEEKIELLSQFAGHALSRAMGRTLWTGDD